MSGHHLKKLRMANGLSQTYVAKELHIDRAKVSRWENDIILPCDEELKALAKLYSVDIRTLKSRLSEIDSDTPLKGSESLIAEKIDELHLSVSNELNAAIANQKESIRQQGEQIEIQKESLERFSKQLQSEQKLKEEYRNEIKDNQAKYSHVIKNLILITIISILFLALMTFTILIIMNYKANNHEYAVEVSAIEIDPEE